MSSTLMRVVQSLIIGATLVAAVAALAATESSCPPPCTKLPKSSLSMRETSTLDAGGWASLLTGKLNKGQAHTIVRVQADITVDMLTPMNRVMLEPQLNGAYYTGAPLGITGSVCDSNKSTYCATSASFWWDIDAMEAAHPGEFVGKPLDVWMWAGAFMGGNNVGAGSKYVLSFSVQVVKKK